MKKTHNKLMKLLVFISFFVLLSCVKDDSLPIQGEQGIAGTGGSIIHSGVGTPDDEIGNTGDYYLDKENTDLYGPKTSSGWGNPLNLRGAKGLDGATGAPGSQIYSGEGQPQASLGNVSDFYFDKTEAALYGPKSESGWGSPVNLRPANDNGVKIVIIKNHKFEELRIVRDGDHGFSGYLSSRIIPVPDYTDYYENGVVLVYFRLSEDTDGAWYQDPDTEFHLDYPYLNGNLFTGYYYPVKYGKDHITIDVEFMYEYDYGSNPPVDIQDLVVEHMKENLVLDFKFVLIPGTQVSAMQQRNINVEDFNAVANFFGLE